LLPAGGNLLKIRVLLFFFLWGLLGMGGFQPAMGSDARLGRLKEAQDHRSEIELAKNEAYGPDSLQNVYLEWDKPTFFRGQIFSWLRPAEDPSEPLFFVHGSLGTTGQRNILVNEGETTSSDSTQKEPSKPERDWKGIGLDTAFFLGYQVVFAGVLWFLPESVTAWTEDQKKATLAKWKVNVQNPVWDHDKFWINYIAHPYFGATYYTRARERGFGEFGSFSYSFLLSACYEFGIEAFFEPPSKNDLIATPVGGYLLGKYVFEPIRDMIKAKPQLKWYDHAGLILTDPLGALNSVFYWLFGIQSDIRVEFHSPELARQMTVDSSEGRSLKGQEVKFSRPQGVNLQLHLDW
jgi:Domain of unknown function (DUF3943)